MDLNLPPVMQRCVQFFQQYYNMEVRGALFCRGLGDFHVRIVLLRSPYHIWIISSSLSPSLLRPVRR
jgi:hypothetical protein